MKPLGEGENASGWQQETPSTFAERLHFGFFILFFF
jgi:hypothetical protein